MSPSGDPAPPHWKQLCCVRTETVRRAPRASLGKTKPNKGGHVSAWLACREDTSVGDLPWSKSHSIETHSHCRRSCSSRTDRLACRHTWRNVYQALCCHAYCIYSAGAGR